MNDELYTIMSNKDGVVQSDVQFSHIDVGGGNFNNVNVNAFENKGWNKDNGYPTNGTNSAWPTKISVKGWFLAKTQKITDKQYYIWLTNVQQNSTIVYGGTIDANLIVEPSNIAVNQLLTVHTNNSYTNHCLVQEVAVGDDNKAIKIKIVNCETDPFSGNFGYVPYFKGTVLITGEASTDSTKANYIDKLETTEFNDVNFISKKYLDNGIVDLGYCNLSVGDSNVIAGFEATAVGPDNTIIGAYSNCFGSNNQVFGYAATAIGQNHKVFGEKTLVCGAEHKVSAYFSFIAGYANNVYGYSQYKTGGQQVYSGFTVSGQMNTLDIRNSSTVPYHPSNVVLGFMLQSYTPNQIVVGRFNKPSNSMFIVGNGTGNAEQYRKNIFEITNEGMIKLPVFNGPNSTTATGEYATVRVYKDSDGTYKLNVS